MASQKQPTQQEVVQAIFGYAMELKASGLTKWQIEAKLVEKGLDREAASTVSNKIFNPMPNFASNSRGQMKFTPAVSRNSGSSGFTNMLIGGSIALVGLAITIGTYSAASEGGGRYVVWWGAVIFGGIQFLKGLGQFMSGD